MSEEFDRKAAVLAELATLEGNPGDVLGLANARWTATGIEGDGSWQDLAESLLAEVQTRYKDEEVDPRSPHDVASKVADVVVGTPNLKTLVAWFGVLDEILSLKASGDGSADEETFSAIPGTTVREVITGGMVTVLTVAATNLITYLEEVADAAEEKWNEAHAEPEPEPGAGEKHPADWV